jgi:hypothetical protein
MVTRSETRIAEENKKQKEIYLQFVFTLFKKEKVNCVGWEGGLEKRRMPR